MKIRSVQKQTLRTLVGKGDLAGAVIVPNGYSQALQAGTALKLIIIIDQASTSSTTVQTDIQAATNRLMSAVQTARIVEKNRNDPAAFGPAFDAAITAWQQPPIEVTVITSGAIQTQSSNALSMAHSSPSMMLQFAIAGLLTAGTVIVNERKTRSLQRLLTTATSRVQILMGHYLAIFIMIFIQFILLIGFGQLVLKVDYLRLPLATLLISIASAMCIAALGLLIGILSKSEEQVIIFALIPMFVLSGLGGAWVPLEVTGPTFQTVGHMSPVAWSLDGYANIITRGLSINSILLPTAALLGYAILFFFLAAWRFQRSEER